MELRLSCNNPPIHSKTGVKRTPVLTPSRNTSFEQHFIDFQHLVRLALTEVLDVD